MDVDVLVVGAGPAGLSTALHLVQTEPAWAERMVVIDKATFPREKVCGGGVTQFAERLLANLGLTYREPHVAIHEIRFVYGNCVYALRDIPVFRVVHRSEFDAWLLRQCEARGIAVHQGQTARVITNRADVVELITENTTYHTKVLVAADGSPGFVRQQLKWGGHAGLALGLEVLTPEIESQRFEFRDGVAIYDFSPMKNGLQGYCWTFPSCIDGKPFMNRGIFDSRINPHSGEKPLAQLFADALSKQGLRLGELPLQGHTIRRFGIRDTFSQPRILLAGDAAGVDPFLGEGISFALAYGEVAATQIVHAFSSQDFSMADYRNRILTHPLLSQLRFRAMGARYVYKLTSHPWLAERLGACVPILFRLLARFKPRYIPLHKPRLLKL